MQRSGFVFGFTGEFFRNYYCFCPFYAALSFINNQLYLIISETDISARIYYGVNRFLENRGELSGSY